ncbi:hypothetical protein GCM10027074_39270 [Streptomyces deserti]
MRHRHETGQGRPDGPEAPTAPANRAPPVRLRPERARGSLVRVASRYAAAVRVHLSIPFDPVVHKGVTGHRHEWITAPRNPVPRSVYAR